MHISVTAVTTDSGGTDSAVTAVTIDSAVTAVTINSAVTAMFTFITVSCHRCHTNVHIIISALSLPLLSQRCACFRSHIENDGGGGYSLGKMVQENDLYLVSISRDSAERCFLIVASTTLTTSYRGACPVNGSRVIQHHTKGYPEKI